MLGKISGAILAGGANTRFNGETKAKIVIEGKTIISRTIDTLSQVFNEIIIVTNTPDEFSEYSQFKIISDHFKKKGPLGGIHSALKSTSGDAIFIFAGDMPFINMEIISRMTDYYLSNSCEVLIPSTGTYIEPLHAIYSVKILNRLEQYISDENNFAVRQFIKIVDTCYQQLGESIEIRKAFTNINTVSDMKKAEKSKKDDLIHSEAEWIDYITEWLVSCQILLTLSDYKTRYYEASITVYYYCNHVIHSM